MYSEQKTYKSIRMKRIVKTKDLAELENDMRLIVVITYDTLRVLSQLTRCVMYIEMSDWDATLRLIA